MIVRGLRYVTGAAFAVLLSVGLASNGLAQTDALWAKATEAAEITAIAQQNGHVRVIVMFDSPVPASQLKSDPAGVANAKAQVAAARDPIVAWHFGSATSPTQGQGFDRGLARFQITPGFAVNVSPAELQALANDPRVTRINYDRILRTKLIDSVPLIGMTAAYTQGATGATQVVAVLDTGVKSDHEFLFGKVVAEACFSNAVPAANRFSLCPNTQQSQTGPGSANAETFNCLNGTENLCLHGTHVAGIAAGLNTNQQAGEPPNGVAKDAKIFAIQIFTKFTTAVDCNPDPTPCVGSWVSDQIDALDYVFSNINPGGGTTVASVNMSLGGGLFSGTCDSAPHKPAIDNLRAAGVLTAIASGNDNSTNQISMPACISSAVAVGATTKQDAVSPFSNISSAVDLLAPGSSIQSSIPQLVVGGNNNTTTYLFANGTSMAAPHVAGAIAAIRSACPAVTPDTIENLLKNTGTPIPDTRPGGTLTKPRIRVDLAVESCLGTPPVITQNPSNLTVAAGQQATFTAAATATPAATVIWQVSTNGGGHYDNIAWATSTTLSFTTIASHNGYLFRAVFTNSVGSATTIFATLTVNSGGAPVAPVITQNPSNLTVTAGQEATFTAAASGTPTPTVIWQVSFDGGVVYHNIGWATSTTLTFTTMASHNGYRFRAVFTNSAGNATTGIAMLTVNSGGGPTPPVVTQNPSDLTVTEGQQATFTAAATGSPTPTVQWQVSFDGGTVYHNIGGATSTTLTFTTIASHNGYLFRAVFTNSVGSATTAVVTLLVNPGGPSAPIVTQNPSPLTVAAGQQATFTAAATGTPTPTVIWQVSTNGGATYNSIAWATSTTLSFTTIASHNGYLFRAVFTNSAGSTTTVVVTLTVT